MSKRSFAIAALFRRVSQLGTEGLPPEEERKTRLLNQSAAIAAATCLAFTALYWSDPKVFWFGLVANLTAFVIQCSVPLLVARGHRLAAIGVFLATCNGHLAAVAHYLGPQVGYQYYFFAFAAVVFLVTPRRAAFFYPFSLVSVAAYLYFTFVMEDATAAIHLDPRLASAIKGVTIVTTFGTLVLLGYLFDADTRHAEQNLAVEHERSEQLLLNILPPTISTRLKGGEQSIADGFAEVSVLFADIVGFTELSARLPPAELVRVLNEVFTSFDEIAGRLDLEKIKTIGDCYMVAAGLPVPRPDHARVTVEMALCMRDELARINATKGYGLAVRIGVHSGPVVAGVIGKKKFIYDLWGDTVNTASRMESHGIRDTVHVSETTADLVRDAFELESRGPIAVKGKGEMTTYLVKGAKAAHAKVRLPSAEEVG